MSAQVRSATIMAAAPVLRPGALPAVIVPSLRNAGLSLERLSSVVSGRLCSSLSNFDRTFSRGDFDSGDFSGEFAGRLRGRKPLLRPLCPTILLFAGDLVRAREILGVPSGVLTGERIVEAVHEHRIVDLPVAHAVAPTAGAHEIRRAVHVLHAAGDRAVDESEHHLLCRACDRLSARAADAVHGHRRNIDRHAAVDSRLSGRVHLVAGLDHVAHDDRIHVAGRQFGALERRADRRPHRDRWPASSLSVPP